jgi:hypothetical protein
VGSPLQTPFIAKPNPACAASTAMATASLVAARAIVAAKVSWEFVHIAIDDHSSDQRKESAVAFLFATIA